MPCLEITLPKISLEIKEKCSRKLTEAFQTATGMDASIFAIQYKEYAMGEVAVGGKMWNGGEESPYLHFLLYCPRLKRSTKEKLAEAFTSAFLEGTGKKNWFPVIHICEHPYDNVVVEGDLLSNKFQACRDKKFYYDLPRD